MASVPEPSFDPGEARRAVEEVLAGPEYAELEPGLLERLLDAALERLADGLSALEGTDLGVALGVALLVVALVAAGTLLVRLLRGVRPDPAAGAGGAARRPPPDWLAEAERHERTGALRDALRCRYRALVAALADEGLVEEVAGATTGEYRAEVAARAPAVAPPFAAVTAAFEGAWYGGESVGHERLADVRARADEALAAARARRGLAVGARA